MERVRVEELTNSDPSVNIEPDLRLTMKEWVLYWKVRYESSLEKIVNASKFIDALREKLKEAQAANTKLQARIDEMQAQYSSEVKARQEKQTEGKPEPKLKAVEAEPEEPKKTSFKRRKKKA